MSEKKFTSKEFLAQCRQCPEMAYEFSVEEVLEGVRHFLGYVGYKLLSPPSVNPVKPEFYAGRCDYKVTGVVRHSVKEIADGLADLRKIKNVMGDVVDYVLALPPVHELWLHEFFASREGIKWFSTIRDERLLIWLCNPEKELVSSLFNSPRDKRFQDYFGPYSNLELMGMIEHDKFVLTRKSTQNQYLKTSLIGTY